MSQQNMYQQPGSSWGNVNNNQQSSQASSMNYDDDFSDEYSDDYESEDEPLAMSSWGNQTTTQDGTTEYNVSAAGWAALIDPNFKVGPGGIGSGNLHRKGGNYKPVDEEHILNHRLKKGAMPGGKKKKKSRSATPTPPPSSRGRGRGRGRGSAPPSSRPSPSVAPSRYARQPPTNNAWGGQQLADKPFWEQPAGVQSATSSNTGASASRYAPSGGAASSRYAPQQEQQSTWGQQQPQQQQPTWGQQQQSTWGQQQPQQQQSTWGQQQPQQQQSTWGQQQPSQWKQPEGSSNSNYATQPEPQGSSSSRYATADSGSGASKWASGASSSKYATPMSTSSSADSIYASNEVKQSKPITPPPQQHDGANILSIKIEFMPGVTAALAVPNEPNIDYIKLVEDFISHHRFHIEDHAKAAFAANLQKLVEMEYAKRRARQ